MCPKFHVEQPLDKETIKKLEQLISENPEAWLTIERFESKEGLISAFDAGLLKLTSEGWCIQAKHLLLADNDSR